MSKRLSKQKRDLIRKARLHAEQSEVLQKALKARHCEQDATLSDVVRVRTGLRGVESKALHGPRSWAPREPVAIVSKSIGHVIANDKPHALNTSVRPTPGKTKKRGSLDGFTPKMIDALLSKEYVK